MPGRKRVANGISTNSNKSTIISSKKEFTFKRYASRPRKKAKQRTIKGGIRMTRSSCLELIKRNEKNRIEIKESRW